MSRRTYLAQAAKTMGVDVDELLDRKAEFPDEAAHLWSAFLQLSAVRGNNGFAPSAIDFQDIRAWCELTGVVLNPWEVEVINRLDRVYLEVFAPKAEPTKR